MTKYGPCDSAGVTLHIGDRVRFHGTGEVLRIADFVPGQCGDQVVFEESDDVAECWEVDFVSRPPV